MKTLKFTDGNKEMKTYIEISNKEQGCYGNNEILRKVRTDDLEMIENSQYDTRFEEVK